MTRLERQLRDVKGVRVRSRRAVEAYVKVGAAFRSATFALDTPDLIERIMLWQLDTRKQIEAGRAEKGTLASDIERFLVSLAPAAGYDTAARRARRRHLDFSIHLSRWRAALGHRPRRSITVEDCREALERWQREDGLSASSLNHIRQALISLWRYCDGADAACPASKLPKWDEGKPQARAYDYDLLVAAVEALAPSKSKARLSLMLVTGARPFEVGLLRPEDIRLDADRPFIHFTSAKAGDDRAVPLSPAGVRAAQLFVEQGAFGHFSNGSLGKALRVGFAAAGVEPTCRVTPYTIRHTVLTRLRQRGADLADVAAWAGHKSPQTTKRYAPTVTSKLVTMAQSL